MRRDVNHYVRNNHSCQRTWYSQHSMLGVFRPFPVPTETWEDYSINFGEGLPESKEFDVIWVVVDRHSNLPHFGPYNTTIDAPGLADFLQRDVVHLHVLQATLLSDWGPLCAATYWDYLCGAPEIDLRILTSFHLQMDSQMERIYTGLEQYLRVIVNQREDDWVKWLLMAEFAANNWVSETTQCTLCFAVQGVDPQMSFSAELIEGRDQWQQDADPV